MPLIYFPSSIWEANRKPEIMEDAENNFMDAISKFQEAFELVKEHGGGSASLLEEIEELKAQEEELEGAKEELKGEFEEICRTYLAMEEEAAEYDQLKVS